MQHAHKRSQTQEVRVRLHEHPLDFVQLRGGRGALLLRSFGEALGQCSENRELPKRHRLELDLERQRRRRRVDLDVLRSEVPEFVGENDGAVVGSSSGIALCGDVDVCTRARSSVPRDHLQLGTSTHTVLQQAGPGLAG